MTLAPYLGAALAVPEQRLGELNDRNPHELWLARKITKV